MRLQERVVIITGAGRGIGLAFAQGMAAEGARVVVAEIDVKAGQKAAREIKAQGGDALFVHADITSEQSTMEMAAAAIKAYGAIDVLINNAALFGGLQMKPVEEIHVEEWDKVMAVNLRGLFLTVRAVLPQMKKQGQGKIINISSNTVFSGGPLLSHYVTSKAGVIGFTRSLAKEVGRSGICVNAVTPGLTGTEAAAETIPVERFETVAGLRALGRHQEPVDLLGTVLFLASADSDFITGQTINVDGGQILY